MSEHKPITIEDIKRACREVLADSWMRAEIARHEAYKRTYYAGMLKSQSEQLHTPKSAFY